MKFLEIPLSPEAQTFRITLSDITLRFTFRWNRVAGYWLLSIADVDDVPLLSSLPVVPGLDLLAQHYAVLNLPGWLVVQTDGDPDAPPTYDNLGNLGRMYYVTP